MKFKKKVSKYHTTDFWYDLFEGGYLKPKKIVKKESQEEIEKAISILKKYKKELIENGVVEEI